MKKFIIWENIFGEWVIVRTKTDFSARTKDIRKATEMSLKDAERIASKINYSNVIPSPYCNEFIKEYES